MRRFGWGFGCRRGLERHSLSRRVWNYRIFLLDVSGSDWLFRFHILFRFAGRHLTIGCSRRADWIDGFVRLQHLVKSRALGFGLVVGPRGRRRLLERALLSGGWSFLDGVGHVRWISGRGWIWGREA